LNSKWPIIVPQYIIFSWGFLKQYITALSRAVNSISERTLYLLVKYLPKRSKELGLNFKWRFMSGAKFCSVHQKNPLRIRIWVKLNKTFIVLLDISYGIENSPGMQHNISLTKFPDPIERDCTAAFLSCIDQPGQVMWGGHVGGCSTSLAARDLTTWGRPSEGPPIKLHLLYWSKYRDSGNMPTAACCNIQVTLCSSTTP